MNLDARISTGLPGHTKTKKLINMLGQAGAWNLICLFLYAAQNKPDGHLEGMSDEDLELAADWFGAEGDFVIALKKARFLDGEEGNYTIHDWQEHNPWAAGAQSRSDKARLGGLISRYGEVRGRQMFHAGQAPSQPTDNKPSTTSPTASQQPVVVQSAQSATPSPSPSPSPKQKTLGRSGEPSYTESFLMAFEKYPKRQGGNPKRSAAQAWNARKTAGCTDVEMIAGVQRYAAFCVKAGKVGTQYVMQAATFFGPDKHFLEEWAFTPSPTPTRPGSAPGNAETETAWLELRACIRADKPPTDPAIAEAYRAIGGYSLMSMKSEDIDKRRIAFDTAWLRASARPPQRVADLAASLVKTE